MGMLIDGGDMLGVQAAEGTMARGVSDGDKLQGNSLPEIRDAWEQATIDFKRDPEIRDAARGALRPGNLLNAFALWCLSRPEPERRAIAAWGLRALERLKDSPSPIDLRKLPREDFGSLGGNPDKDDGMIAERRPRVSRSRSHAASTSRSKKTG